MLCLLGRIIKFFFSCPIGSQHSQSLFQRTGVIRPSSRGVHHLHSNSSLPSFHLSLWLSLPSSNCPWESLRGLCPVSAHIFNLFTAFKVRALDTSWLIDNLYTILIKMTKPKTTIIIPLVKWRKGCKFKFPCWHDLLCFNKYSNSACLTSLHEVKYDERHSSFILNVILCFSLKIRVLGASPRIVLATEPCFSHSAAFLCSSFAWFICASQAPRTGFLLVTCRTHCSFSLLHRHKTETDQPVLRLCPSHHSESVVVELMNGNLLRYTSGI